MSKEYLEALENLKELGYLIDEVSGLTKYVYEYDDSFDSRLEYICEQIGKIKNKLQPALQRLEAIDNANHSEALESFDRILHCNDEDYSQGYYNHDITVVKQSLLKAQEQEKVLEILFKKQVDLGWLWYCIHECVNSLNEYNKKMPIEKFKLTEEEFNLLKRGRMNNAIN